MWSGTQMRKSDNIDWWCDRQQPPENLLWGLPFVGTVSGETPALPRCEPEVRRRDVGEQSYGSGVPRMTGTLVDRDGLLKRKQGATFTSAATAHGDVLLSHSRQELGFMPTAAAANFLSTECLGSRRPTPPQRYYP